MIIKSKINYNKLTIQSKFEFLNFGLGGWEIQIRYQRPRKFPSTEFLANQITFGILVHHIRDGIDQARHDFARCRFSTTDRARTDCARE